MTSELKACHLHSYQYYFIMMQYCITITTPFAIYIDCENCIVIVTLIYTLSPRDFTDVANFSIQRSPAFSYFYSNYNYDFGNSVITNYIVRVN